METRKKGEKTKGIQSHNGTNTADRNAKKREKGWDMLYPEEKDRHPRHRVMRVKKTKDDLRELNKLLKKINRNLHGKPEKKKNSTGGTKAVPKIPAHRTRPPAAKPTSEQRQKCMVKMYYGNSKESHLRHLEEYMTQAKKSEVEKNRPCSETWT